MTNKILLTDDIFNHSFPSSGIHVFQVILAFHRLAMSTLIMNDADIAVTGKETHERIIVFLVVAHAVNELYDASRLPFIRRDQHRCKIKIIDRRLDICLLLHEFVTFDSSSDNTIISPSKAFAFHCLAYVNRLAFTCQQICFHVPTNLPSRVNQFALTCRTIC